METLAKELYTNATKFYKKYRYDTTTTFSRNDKMTDIIINPKYGILWTV